MERFRYEGVDASGKRARGEVESSSERTAYRSVVSRGVTPTSIRAVKAGGGGGERSARGRTSEGRSRRGGKVRAEDIASVTYQLSVMVGARIPLVEALRTIADNESNARLSAILVEVSRQVGSGRSLTESLSAYERVFGRVYLQTVRAAETTGNLIGVLERLAVSVEEEGELRASVRGALIYPVAVVVALTGALLFLVTFVVPRFARMFEARGVELPFLTRAMVDVGGVMTTYWWAFIGVGVIVWVIFMQLRNTSKARLFLDRSLGRVPFVGEVLRSLAVSRFASIFGLGLSSGLGLIEALEAGGRASGRALMMRDSRHLAESVRRGERLDAALRGCVYLPGFAKQLIRAGEASGELASMSGVVARHFGKRTMDLTKNSAKVAEPILVAGLAGLVLVVALAVFVPMWDMVVVLE